MYFNTYSNHLINLCLVIRQIKICFWAIATDFHFIVKNYLSCYYYYYFIAVDVVIVVVNRFIIVFISGLLRINSLMLFSLLITAVVNVVLVDLIVVIIIFYGCWFGWNFNIHLKLLDFIFRMKIEKKKRFLPAFNLNFLLEKNTLS